MELGTRELVQFISLIATLAGAFAVVKSQLQRVMSDLQKLFNEIEKINDRLDVTTEGAAVFRHQVNVLGGILSPANLKHQAEQITKIEKDIEHVRENLQHQIKIHNGKHPPVSE